MSDPRGAAPVDVIERARAGDRDALGALVADHLPLVYGIVGRSLGPSGDVDDVVQEVMMRVVSSLPALGDPTCFRSWLVTVTYRQVVDHRRARGRRPAPQDVTGDSALLTEPADVADEVVSEILLTDQRRAVSVAARWLDASHQDVLGLWWHEVFGLLDRRELARALGVDVPHAAVKVQRMREQLDAARTVVLALAATPRCPGLHRAAARWDGRPSPLWRKRLARHVRACTRCGQPRHGLVPLERLVLALGLLPLPASVLAAAPGWVETAAASGTPLLVHVPSWSVALVERVRRVPDVLGVQHAGSHAAAVAAVVVGGLVTSSWVGATADDVVARGAVAALAPAVARPSQGAVPAPDVVPAPLLLTEPSVPRVPAPDDDAAPTPPPLVVPVEAPQAPDEPARSEDAPVPRPTRSPRPVPATTEPAPAAPSDPAPRPAEPSAPAPGPALPPPPVEPPPPTTSVRGVVTADIYVATDGSDDGDGSYGRPFETLARAFAVVRPGETIAVRGGVHHVREGLEITTSGTPDAPIVLSGYRDETAVLDLSAVPATTWPVVQRADRWTVRALELTGSRSHGYVCVSCAESVFERLSLHDNTRSGLLLRGEGTSGNVVRDCDMFANHDDLAGGAAGIGLGIVFGSGAGNLVERNRFFHNADDGVDLAGFTSPVTLRDNESFGNGVDRWGMAGWAGNGGGFTLGGGPEPLAVAHVLERNVARDNGHHGFTDGRNAGAIVLVDNVARGNGAAGYFLADAAAVLSGNVAEGNGVAARLGPSVLDPSGIVTRDP